MVTPSSQASHGGMWVRTFTASERPVTMPSLAARCCRKISISVLSETTQSSWKPNWEPPAMLVAQLPGSMKPMVTTNPGPR